LYFLRASGVPESLYSANPLHMELSVEGPVCWFVQEISVPIDPIVTENKGVNTAQLEKVPCVSL
jgi:hypothetical protein